MSKEIKLGDQVQDLVSGYKGIAVMRTKFLNGCVQYTVVGKVKEGTKPQEEEVSVDEASLKVLKRNAAPSCEYLEEEEEENEEFTGGPNRLVKRRYC